MGGIGGLRHIVNAMTKAAEATGDRLLTGYARELQAVLDDIDHDAHAELVRVLEAERYAVPTYDRYAPR